MGIGKVLVLKRVINKTETIIIIRMLTRNVGKKTIILFLPIMSGKQLSKNSSKCDVSNRK